MATVLNTVADFVAEARVLLQDTVVEYRYPDVDILAALNNGLQEAIRIRQFLFRSNNYVVPTYSVVDNTPVNFSLRYRPALLYYMVGWLQLRDDDENSDQLGGTFIKLFREELLGNA